MPPRKFSNPRTSASCQSFRLSHLLLGTAPFKPSSYFHWSFPRCPHKLCTPRSCLSGCLTMPTSHIGQSKSETWPVPHSFSPHVTHPTGKGLHPSEPRWEAHPWGGRHGGAVSPGGCQDEAEDAIGVLGQLLQDGEDEGGRLAAARLGTSQAVPSWDKQDNSIDTVQTRFGSRRDLLSDLSSGQHSVLGGPDAGAHDAGAHRQSVVVQPKCHHLEQGSHVTPRRTGGKSNQKHLPSPLTLQDGGDAAELHGRRLLQPQLATLLHQPR